MCDAPYDYCGPTYHGDPCEYCADARMNSAFTPFPYVGGTEEAAPQSMAPAASAPTPTDLENVPGTDLPSITPD
jgi:hypothetical protein